MSTVINLSSLTADTGFVIQGARAEEIAGMKIANAGDINGDGYEDIILGAPLSDLNGQRSGVAYVVFGKAGGFGTIDLANLGSAGFVIRGPSTFAYSGLSVGGGGDINGDGFDDLIIGSPYDNRADIVFGKSSGFGTVDLDGLGGANGFTVFGRNAASYAGGAVANADINGDGFDDILIGDPGGYYYSSDRAFAVFGKASGFANVDLTSSNTLFQGTMNSETARSLASAGDFNGDGFDDVIVAAPFKSSGRGEVYVIFGKAGSFTTLDPNNLGAGGFTIQSAAADDFAGDSVSSAGDFNGDGYDDIIVGAPNNDAGGNNAGAAYVIFGKAGGLGTVDLGNLGALGFAIIGGAASTFAGDSVAAGDVNGDGLSDIIVGAPGSAEVYVVYGKTSGFGTVNLGSLSDSAGFVILGPANDGIGNSVASADVNGDGASDVIVGAAFADAAGNNSGRAYVVFGSNPVVHFQAGTAAADQLIGSAERDNLAGLGGNDNLSGLAGNDILDGGTDDDLLSGGTGDDVYVVDSAGDVAVEDVGAGFDTIYANVSYRAAANVERIGVNGFTTSFAINLTGNGLGNEMIGNGGANILDGDTGADLMKGLDGDDIYVVDNVGDVVLELPGGGYDMVYTSVSFTLGAEADRLLAIDAAGTSYLALIGTGLSNELTGNDGGNMINGGFGADILMGRGGGDAFFFTTALGGGNVDQIRDFQVGLDKMALDDAVFAGLPAGALAAGAFRTGTAAGDADDRIIYDPATGALFYDADGNGAGAAVQFATVSSGLVLSASDFIVV
jgi:Ca2+-binding RTX toxin-like protein